MAEAGYALQMKNIRKTFGTLVANDNINLDIKKGTIHAVIGENGAGKSTLMNILTSITKQDSGEIYLHGEKVSFKDSLDAAKHGIGMIYQEFMLYPELSVFDNIILGFEEKKFGIYIDKKACREKIEKICTDYNFDIPLKEKIKELPVAVLQQVEIVKILYRGADIIIMDEPTSVLTPQGIRGLFDAMRILIAAGKTIIFISHKLKEVFEIADKITILKLGKLVATVDPEGLTEPELASMMVGRDVILKADKVDVDFGDPVLSVRNLNVRDKDKILRVRDVSFDIKAGEIVGIAGVAGSGQQQLVEALFGLRAPEFGSEIEFLNESIVKTTPRARRCMGIGYVPQDRLALGSNINASVWENAIMGYHIAHGFKSKLFLNFKKIEEFTNSVVEKFAVKRQRNSDKVKSLSGGNIQKLIVGREFTQDNKLLIIEDPTRGIDVGAIEFIWQKIIELAANGTSILLVSHELNEIMQLADRILVVYSGQVVEAGKYGENTEDEIGLLMLGGSLDENE